MYDSTASCHNRIVCIDFQIAVDFDNPLRHGYETARTTCSRCRINDRIIGIDYYFRNTISILRISLFGSISANMYSSGIFITISIDDQTVCGNGHSWSLINFFVFCVVVTKHSNTVRFATIYLVRIYSYLARWVTNFSDHIPSAVFLPHI